MEFEASDLHPEGHGSVLGMSHLQRGRNVAFCCRSYAPSPPSNAFLSPSNIFSAFQHLLTLRTRSFQDIFTSLTDSSQNLRVTLSAIHPSRDILNIKHTFSGPRTCTSLSLTKPPSLYAKNQSIYPRYLAACYAARIRPQSPSSSTRVFKCSSPVAPKSPRRRFE